MPKVSFVISVYNVAPYIERACRCLFEQTLDDLEFVFVDDASPDESMAIMWRVLEEYPNRKPQVKVITHHTNMGVAIANRDSYLASTGEYALLVDPDDFFDTRMAELMYNRAVETDADIVMCNANYETANNKSFVLELTPDGVIGNGENVRRDTITRKIFGSLWCRLMRREVFMRDDFIWEVRNCTSDQVFSVQAAFYAKKISSVDEPLYNYCYHAGSVSRADSANHMLKVIDDFTYNYGVIEKFLKDKGVYEEYESEMIINYKAQIKNNHIRFIDQPGFRKRWYNTFPEVNKLYIWGDKDHKPTYRERFWFFSVATGLYPYIKRIVWCKYLRPRSNWMIHR